MKNYTQYFDYDFARKPYTAKGQFSRAPEYKTPEYMKYRPAYVTTNEDLRHTINNLGMVASGKHVLTTTGSGDHPLFYTLAGAAKTDTFDITICAKTIMDIKTTALQQNINQTDYSEYLSRIYKKSPNQSDPTFQRLLPHLPSDSINLIKNLNGLKIFSSGCNTYDYPEYQLTANEYTKLQQKINASYPFIWSNVTDLQNHLNCQYDIINLSNIFEWNLQIIIPALEKLRPFVKPGGYIVALTSSWINNAECKIFYHANKKFKDWAIIGLTDPAPITRCRSFVLTRTR